MISRFRRWLASGFNGPQAQNTEIELKRLELEIARERVKEIELQCQHERLEAETAKAYAEMEAEEPQPQRQFVYQSDYPPPDFDKFFVLVDHAQTDPAGNENELFTIMMCGRNGNIGEVWHRSTEERAVVLANWITLNHARCEGIINRLHAVYH